MRRLIPIVVAGLMSVAPLSAQSTQALLDQAKAAFLSAQKMESALNDRSVANRKRPEYLKVIDAYQRVYLITPHTGYADDALVAVARIYEEIQDPADAIKTLRFMIHDYPQSPFKAAAERDIERLQNNRDVKEIERLQNNRDVKETERLQNNRDVKETERLQNARDVKEAVTEKSPDPTLKPDPAASPASPADKKNVTVENVRYWEGPNSIRVVVDVSGDVRYTKGEAKSPDRVFVDLASAKLPHALLNKQWPVNTSLLQQIRVGQFDNTTVRVVLDLGNTESVTSFTMRDPNRLIIDVLGKGAPALTRASENPYVAPPDNSPAVANAVAAASAPDPGAGSPQVGSAPATEPFPVAPVATVVPPPVPQAPQAPQAPAAVASAANPTPAKLRNGGGTSLVRSLGLKISKVVIDAGHGGNDTGTIGPTGYTEKDFSLDIARRLKTLIENELGAEVVMTRSEDVFVPLEARTAIANQHQADLFISIHANSSKVASARGVETFYLNYPPPSRDALELASRENASSQASIHELQDIIKKIMMNDKASESRELAGHIQKAMAERKDAGPDRGVKEAPFVVLIGANMPSILAEVGFISNPQEERSAKAPAYRQQIAESLFKGIRSYAETLSGAKTAKSFEKN